MLRDVIALVPILASFALAPVGNSQEIVINEFLAINEAGLRDGDGEFSDWIELRNTTTRELSLQYWSLTDDPAQPRRWVFSSGIIAPNGYLIVFASGKNRTAAGAELHTNFKLDGDGEFLALVKPDGVTVSSQFAPAYPKQHRNISYGLGADGNLHYLRTTPRAGNGSNYVEFVADTKFSSDRGFYDAPVSVVITTATASATIYYTTNGTSPSPTNGFAYVSPLVIGGTTVLKAVAHRAGFEPSSVDTHTYLFLADIIRQDYQSVVGLGFPTNWGTTAADYGLDADVVGSEGTDRYGGKYTASLSNDLRSLPTVSLALPANDLFGPDGIYTRSDQSGDAWERPVSFELLYPDGRKSVHAAAGVRIHGGSSRFNFITRKHSFRIVFREQYGPGKLNRALFGFQAAEAFDTLVLRAGGNDGYSWEYAAAQPLYLRDSFIRRSLLDMKGVAARDFFVHLYLNGIYWGLYDLTERPDAAFAESYFGGAEDDWDALNGDGVSNGSSAAWNSFLALCSQGLAGNTAYQRVQGRNPDGSVNPAYPNYLDVDNMIDYLITVFYGGSGDWPVWNYWLLRHQTNNTGFKFMAWDIEISLGLAVTNANVNTTDITNGIGAPYGAARANAEFRLRFGDRVHQHFFNGGPFYVDPAQSAWDSAHPERNRPAARLAALAAQIDSAMVGESARWGDQHAAIPYTRDEHWRTERDRLLNYWIPNRSSNVLQQFRAAGLYPNVAAPQFNQHGGELPAGFQLVISAAAGSIYYTVNGADPRQTNQATFYAGPVSLPARATVKARALSGGQWSALNQATFSPARVPLLITEIHYHPADPSLGERAAGFDDADEFEFLELFNSGPTPIQLTSLRLTNGVRFDFVSSSLGALASGAVGLLVRNRDAFTFRYGNRGPVLGEYQGHLSNGGERLLLIDGTTVLLDVSYGTEAPWPVTADGVGYSLELVDPNTDLNAPTNWQASAEIGGTPGRADNAALRIESIHLQGPQGILRFQAKAGLRYSLFYKPDLTAPSWVPLEQLSPAAAGGPREFEDLLPAGTTQRYYQIASP